MEPVRTARNVLCVFFFALLCASGVCAVATAAEVAFTPVSPTNNQTDFPVTGSLRWSITVTSGDEEISSSEFTYEVYLGSSSQNIQRVAGPGYASTLYTPGDLQVGRTYYWYVRATNGEVTATSDVWAFTTVAEGYPSAPYSPDPADGATETAGDISLRWSPSEGTGSEGVTYTVYFGTTSQNMTVPADGAGITVPHLTPPQPLKGKTLYFWRVEATNDRGNTTSSVVWSFRTMEIDEPLSSGGCALGGASPWAALPLLAGLLLAARFRRRRGGN
jgi:hypothetical protein